MNQIIVVSPLTLILWLSVIFGAGAESNTLDTLTRQIKAQPTHAQLYLERGSYYFNKHKYSLALKDYTHTLALVPDSKSALYNRGNTHTQMKNHTLAIKDYTQALKIDPKYALCYFNRGFAYYLQHNFKAAIQDYHSYLKLVPTDAQGYLKRGNAYFHKTQYTDALKDFEKAYLLDSKMTQALSNQALTQHEMGKYKKAKALYLKLIESDPKSETYGRLSWTLLFLKEAIQAKNAALKGLELNPNAYWILSNLGHAQLLLKDFKNAKESYQTLLYKDPRQKESLKKDFKALQRAGVILPLFKKAAQI